VYNLACYAARQGRGDEALSLLRDAVEHGDGLDIPTDPDLKSLHGDPRFDKLVAKVKEHAASAH
jgi:hypothetical protein